MLPALEAVYPGSTCVSDHGLDASDDESIWELARNGGFVIVTQDSDFAERVHLRGHPPKVIWLRCGNTSTKHVANLLHQNQTAILAFEADPQAGCLEIL